jgi:hypothetical protein
MNGIHTTTVTCVNGKERPKIALFAEWLIPMGFVPNALVQFLPEPNGVSVTLCENVSKYSELAQETHEKGGVLINIRFCKNRSKAYFSISGSFLKNIGLVYGDILMIRYEYGFIRMRKIPANVKKIVTARLVGHWLEELGFVPNSVLTVDSSPGSVTCQLHENGQERTHELYKYARKNKLNLLQVTAQRDNNDAPHFVIPLSRFEKAGLTPGDSFFATYDYGIINILPIDFGALGF